MPKGGFRTSLKFQAKQLASGGWSHDTMFGAGTPIQPPDPQPIRPYDLEPGQNLNYKPRALEPFSFPDLRRFANVELVRLAIETRKDQIERLDWRVKSRDEKKPENGWEDRRKRAEAFLRRPDGINEFHTWLRELMEDHYVLDAATVEKRRTYDGTLVGLDVVDGATIHVLVDDTGRRPTAPNPAFQQIIRGRIWNNLTTDDIIYAVRNRRSNHVYGYSAVEQLVVTINTILARQTKQLAYFTDGNVPQGLLTAPDGWSAETIKQYQEWFDSKLRGNLAERASLIWGPFGAKFMPFKDPPLKDEFDEWLARVVAYAFNLPPTPFIKAMSRATSEEDQDRALEEGREPTMLWAKRFLDSVIQDDMGFPDLEFAWIEPQDIDPEKQAKIDDIRLRNASATLDEVRDRNGDSPYPDGLGEKPMIYTRMGVIPLENAFIDPGAGAGAAPNPRKVGTPPIEGDVSASPTQK